MNQELIIPFQHLQKPLRTVLTITNKKKIGEFLIEVKMFYAYFKVFFNSPHTELLHFGEEWLRLFLEFPIWTQDSDTSLSCLNCKKQIRSLQLWENCSLFAFLATCHIGDFMENAIFLIFSINWFTNASLLLIDFE